MLDATFTLIITRKIVYYLFLNFMKLELVDFILLNY